MDSGYRLMLFDLVIGGHHSFYIQHLVTYWDQQDFLGGLDIVVSPVFLEKHADIIHAASEKTSDIQFVAISSEEAKALKPSTSGRNRLLRALQEWRLMCRYAKHLKASHCLIMYFDTAWLPVALGLKAPCPFSGIYFRPTLHYEMFHNDASAAGSVSRNRREKFVLTRLLKHPQLHTLFTLDLFSVEPISQRIQKMRSSAKIVHLPDPIELHQPSPDAVPRLKAQLGIRSGRKVFLLFGALTGRKGIDQLFSAIQQLPSNLCQQLCLVLLGEGNIDQISTQVNVIKQACPVQIIEHYQFVPNQVVRDYFEMADIVLAPYQKHVGMSGILMWAAAAQKPILSSDYGLMGELVRQWSLGVTVDSTLPEAIAEGLKTCLLKPSDALADPDKMSAFAQSHSADKFVDVISQNWQSDIRSNIL